MTHLSPCRIETTATPEELEDVQEAIAVVLFKLREHSMRLETQQKQLEVDVLLPYARHGAKVLKGNAKGGKRTAKKLKGKVETRDEDIVDNARAMLSAHTPRRGLARRLKRKLNLKLSTRRINAILREKGL